MEGYIKTLQGMFGSAPARPGEQRTYPLLLAIEALGLSPPPAIELAIHQLPSSHATIPYQEQRKGWDFVNEGAGLEM